MRGLTVKQKKLLTKWCKEHPDIAGNIWFEFHKCDAFSLELYEELEAINDFETIHYHVNNFVRDFKKTS